MPFKKQRNVTLLPFMLLRLKKAIRLDSIESMNASYCAARNQCYPLGIFKYSEVAPKGAAFVLCGLGLDVTTQ